MVQYVFVTQGVMSGLNKGAIIASIARILLEKGIDVFPLKLDPSINNDYSRINPKMEDDEVFVLSDGTEVHRDLGIYERGINKSLSGNSFITTGKLISNLMHREDIGGMQGKRIHFIPDLTSELISNLTSKTESSVKLIDVPGITGDIENSFMLEGIRQLINKNQKNSTVIHISFLPQTPDGEQKTKPTQYSLTTLRSFGINPQIVIFRAKIPPRGELLQKISCLCGIPESDIYFLPESASELKTGY